MELKECVKEIVSTIFDSGDYFDSHTVINLIVENPDYYLAYLNEFKRLDSNCTIAQFHAHIARDLIGSLKTVSPSSDVKKSKLRQFMVVNQNQICFGKKFKALTINRFCCILIIVRLSLL